MRLRNDNNKKLLTFLQENVGKKIKVWNCGFEFDIIVESVEKIGGDVVLNGVFKFNVYLFDNIGVTSKFFAVSNSDPDMNEIEILEIEVL